MTTMLASIKIIDKAISRDFWVYNLNVGHATPRAIVPSESTPIDATEQVIRFDYNK